MTTDLYMKLIHQIFGIINSMIIFNNVTAAWNRNIIATLKGHRTNYILFLKKSFSLYSCKNCVLFLLWCHHRWTLWLCLSVYSFCIITAVFYFKVFIQQPPGLNTQCRFTDNILSRTLFCFFNIFISDFNTPERFLSLSHM